MKAAIRDAYGTPDVLTIADIELPVPKKGQVLIRVEATSLNASDLEFLTGSPAYVRAWGLRRPRVLVLGSDVAGRVRSVGPGVTRFRPGDEVFGDLLGRFGCFAEYVVAPASALSSKPPGLSFEDAATLPQAALVAWQALCEKGAVRAGQRVLINGAGGGAGSFAIQIAKARGARVTAVDNVRKFDFMRGLGADEVLDYEKQDFCESNERYDFVLDFVATRSVFRVQRALAADGSYLAVGGSLSRLVHILFLGPLLRLTGRRVGLLAAKANHGVDAVLELVRTSRVVPAITRCLPLESVADGLRVLHEGLACGKIVIQPGAGSQRPSPTSSPPPPPARKPFLGRGQP